MVAVIILMGASMSYAYLAHLNASRLRMEGAEPWSEEAEEALGREEAWFRDAVQSSLVTSVALHDGARSEDLVASIGDGAREDLARRFAERYPYRIGQLVIVIEHLKTLAPAPKYSVLWPHCQQSGIEVCPNPLLIRRSSHGE